MKKRIIAVLIFVSILFINMPLVKVKADSKLNCFYGIVCEYRFCDEKGAIGSCPLNFGTNVVRVAFRCKNSDKSVNSCQQFTAFSGGCRALGDGSDSSLKIGFSVPNAEDQMLDTGVLQCGNCSVPTEYENGVKMTGPNSKLCPYDSYDDCVADNKEWSAGTIGIYFERNSGYVCPPLQISGGFNNSYSGVLEENKIQGTSIRCINSGEDISNEKMQEESCGVTDSLIKESVEEQEESLKDEGSVGDGSIIEAILDWGMGGSDKKYSGDALDPCDLITGDIQTLLHKIFFGISVAGIIILVVMTAVSLVKVITASEDEALRNFFKGLWKRLICLIILLLLPMIVTFVIQLVNNVAPNLGIRSDNPLCDVTE